MSANDFIIDHIRVMLLIKKIYNVSVAALMEWEEYEKVKEKEMELGKCEEDECIVNG